MHAAGSRIPPLSESSSSCAWSHKPPRSTHYDLLDRDLVYDWIWVTGAWDRVGPAALRAREQSGAPELFENFEALAQGQS